MEITNTNSPNFGYPKGTRGRAGHKIEAIVQHVSGGEWGSNRNWITNPSANASYNYYVKKDGEIVCFVPPENAAYANGRINRATWSRLKSGVNPNLYTASVCREGHNHHKPTTAQYHGLLNINYKLIKDNSLAIDRLTLIGHSEIDSVNRWYCPGSGFPWDEFIRDLRDMDKGEEKPEAEPPDGVPLPEIQRRIRVEVGDVVEDRTGYLINGITYVPALLVSTLTGAKVTGHGDHIKIRR